MPEMSADRGIVLQMPLFEARPVHSRPVTEYDFHAISIPARAFTGDFYFTYRAADRLWFALGDVAGKGLPAALVMAMIQEELEHRIHSCAITACDPSITMNRLHTFLKPLLPSNRFATAVIGHLHHDGTLMLANAGHCPPLIARADGRVEELPSTGPVIGILPSSRWGTFETTLGRGESLVLYSDGVVEARSPEGEDFGLQRLAAALSGDSPRIVTERIVTAVNRHSDGAREDDLTVVVVRR